MRLRLPSCAVSAALLMPLILAVFVLANLGNRAEARPVENLPGFTVSDHAVVIKSTLPSCQYEDGSGNVPMPCTWNVNGHDGKAHGLAYVVRMAVWGKPISDYVWAVDPTVNGWHWAVDAEDCAVKARHGVKRFKCANGYKGTLPLPLYKSAGVPA